MITPLKESGLVRITLTLDSVDVDLLDRLARLEGMNRSQEMRSMLGQLRPMLESTVRAFEAALAQRDAFDEKAAQIALSGLEVLMPEVDRLSDAYLGALSRIEGAEAAAGNDEAPASNTGATE